MFYVHIMTTTTANLMFELSKLLEAHGSKAVIEALADACDAAGDHASDMIADDGESRTVHNTFGSISKAMYKIAGDIERIEKRADITLDAAACVLADV